MQYASYTVPLDNPPKVTICGSPPLATKALLEEELVIILALFAIVVPEETTKQRADAVVENVVARAVSYTHLTLPTILLV